MLLVEHLLRVFYASSAKIIVQNLGKLAVSELQLQDWIATLNFGILPPFI